MSKKNTVI